MKRISTVLLICLCTSAFSQVSITDKHMPKSGDTIRYSVAANIGKTSLNKTGTSQTWDFTDLSPTSQGIESYVASSQTPYILSFGFTALGLKLADTLGAAQFQFKNMYTFYRNQSASFADVGLGFQFSTFPLPQAGKHTDPDEIYTFPLTYPDRDSTTFKVTVPISVGIPVGNFYRSGTRINTVDGWGTVSTPYASNVNCIRLKSVITEYDSISVTMASLNFGTTTKRIEYRWVSITEKIPMLFISGSDITGSFVPTIIRYRDNYRQIGPVNTVKAGFVADVTTAGKGEVISFNNTSEGTGLSYNWTINPNKNVVFVNGTSATSEHPKIVINDTGSYSVKLLVTSGSSKDSSVKSKYLKVVGSSRVNGLNFGDFQLYPNPAKGSITFRSSGNNETYKLVVTNVQGQQILSVWCANNDVINTSHITSGPYFITIFDVSNTLRYRTIQIME